MKYSEEKQMSSNVTSASGMDKYVCGEWHSTYECRKPSTSKPKCANCGGIHLSISRRRSISLLPTTSKVVEGMTYKRIDEEIKERGLLLNYHVGFRQTLHAHQPIRINEKIIQKFNITTASGDVLIDIEKAVDKVWHQGVIYKLIQEDMPK